MKDIRKGNDITIHWAIYTKSGSQRIPYALDGKDLTLILGSPYMRKEVKGFSVKGNIITWTYFGKDQKSAGKFSLVLIENEGKEGMHTVDKCNAFRIVNHSCECGGSDDSDVKTVTLEFESTIDMGDSAGSSVDLSAYLATFPQEFSEEQKIQARENIGAESEAFVTDFTVEQVRDLYLGQGDEITVNVALLKDVIRAGRTIKVPYGGVVSGCAIASASDTGDIYMSLETNGQEHLSFIILDSKISADYTWIQPSRIIEITENGAYLDDNLSMGGDLSTNDIELNGIKVRDENGELFSGEAGQVLMSDGQGRLRWQNINTQTGGVVVDSELSETSTNPVQNAVITQNLTGMAQVLTWLDDSIKNRPTKTEVAEEIAKAQLGGSGSVDTSLILTKTEADNRYQPKGANYTNLKGKTVSIIGDSISTFEGYLADSQYLRYFPKYDVTSVEQTWWKLMLNKSGMVLHKNCAWSGSYVTGSSSSTTSASAGCSTKRINDLAKNGVAPDIVICFIGINNLQTSTAGTELGNWKGGTLPSEGTINTFSEAYALMVSKILKKYPRTEVFLCTLLDTNKDGWDNDGTSFPTNKDSRTLKDYNDTIRFIAEAFGVNVIDIHACGVNWFNLDTFTADGLHPNAEGMKKIAEKMLAEISAKSTYAHPVDEVEGGDDPIVPTEYTVTYKYVDVNGATIRTSTTTKVEEGTVINVSTANAPSISGYTISSVTPSGSVTINANTTITYKYTANAVEPTPTYTVTYKYESTTGVKVQEDTTETVTGGTVLNVSTDNAPAISGYTIQSVSPSGSVTISADTTITYIYDLESAPEFPEIPSVPSDYPTETTWYIDVATKSNLGSSFGKGGASYVYVDDALNGAVEGKYVNAFRCAFHTAGTFAYGKCNLDAQTYEKVGSFAVTSADLGKALHIFKVEPFKVEEGERVWFMDSEFAGKLYYHMSPATSDGAFGYGITATNFTPTANPNKNLSIDVGFVVE